MSTNWPQVTDYTGKILTDDDIKEAIERLRSLTLENNKIHKLRNDDEYLLRFLHNCSFNIDAAYKRILAFYDFLLDQKEWIAVDGPIDVKHFLDMNMRFMLPTSDNNGRRIFLCRTEAINPSKITLPELTRIDDLWMESVLDDINVQMKGISIVIDVSGFSWRLFGWVTPGNVKKAVRKIENIITKDVMLHVVKTSSLLNAALKIIMPFLPARIKEQLKFHYNDFSSLHKFISPDNLPKEYGGTVDIDFEALNGKLLARNEELSKKLKHYRSICYESNFH